MKLYHATMKENVHSILEDGFQPSKNISEIEELEAASGINDIVFYSDSLEGLVEEYENYYYVRPEVILEVEVENPYHVNGRMMMEHEYIGSAKDAYIDAIHYEGRRVAPIEW